MSIKQKLVALFLFIGLVPTIVVGIGAYIVLSNQLEDTTSRQLVSLATKQEQKITALLQSKQEEVSKLSNQFDFQVALSRYLAQPMGETHTALTTVLQNTKIEVADLQSISVANTNSVVIASTLDSEVGKQLDEAIIAIPEGADTTTTVREDPRDGINRLYITTRLSVNNKDSGYMTVIFRTDDITAAIQDYTGLGSTGETVIGRKDGNGDVISLFPLRFNTDAALTTKLNSMNLFAANGSNQDSRVAQDYRKQETIIAARPVGFTDWTIATKIDRSEALASIEELRNVLISIMAVSSLIIAVIAWSFGRFFTNPILDIARVSQRIGRGDLTARSTVNRRDEIGALAQSVNAMGQSLGSYVSDIQAQRHRLEIILNSTVESILAIDKQGVILLANQATAQLTKLNTDEIVGKNINDIFHWTHDVRTYEIDYAAPGVNVHPDLEYVNPSGGRHYVKLIMAKVSGEQEQKAAQTIITIHDETKSRELEDMKIDFVSMAAHELRTPLASLRGYLELISFKEPSHDEEVSGYIRQALVSATELGGLINNLLDVTRIERGTLTMNMEEADLAESVAHSVESLRFSAKERQLSLAYSGPTHGEFVYADPVAIREVINNLVANAVKYTQPGGAIEVVFHRDKDVYEVSVKDTGVGIPKRALPHLFTKFYRVHGGLDSGSTGTGLGLFIAKSIVERHNGTIDVQSEEGIGSTFTFRIPVLNDDHRKIIKQQSAEKVTRKHRGWITKNITR